MKGKAMALLISLIFLVCACQGTKVKCRKESDITPSPDKGKIILQWDTSKEQSNLAGYRVYYGPSSGKYENCVDIGKGNPSAAGVMTYTLFNLVRGDRYYLAVEAYQLSGKPFQGSELSKEIMGVAK